MHKDKKDTFAVSQRSVCIKSFPVALLKHRRLQRLWCWALCLFKRKGRTDVEYLIVKLGFSKMYKLKHKTEII